MARKPRCRCGDCQVCVAHRRSTQRSDRRLREQRRDSGPRGSRVADPNYADSGFSLIDADGREVDSIAYAMRLRREGLNPGTPLTPTGHGAAPRSDR